MNDLDEGIKEESVGDDNDYDYDEDEDFYDDDLEDDNN